MRKAVVAGQFYPYDEDELNEEIERFLENAKPEIKNSYGFVVPHAGHIYSGQTAAIGFKSAKNLSKVETVILLGPNHSGMGAPIAVSFDEWETPFGTFFTDKDFAERLIDGESFFKDEWAHKEEHSIEVQLPFLYKINPKAKIVCICLASQTKETAKRLAKKIIDTEKELKRKIIIIASSDFTHYEPAEIAEEKDMLLIENIKELDIGRRNRCECVRIRSDSCINEICKTKGS